MSHESINQQVGSAVFHKEMIWYLYKLHYYLNAPEKKRIMNTKSFYFLIMENLGQWRTKVDKTTKTGYSKAVAWGTSGKGEKEWFTYG